MSSRFDAYRVDGTTIVDATFWNRIFRDLDTRILGIEEKKADFEEAERFLLEVGLNRINNILLPAAERVFRVAELGFLIASSDEEATFSEGQPASITLRDDEQRALFTPGPFIALTRRSTPDDYVIAKTTTYDPDSGILLFQVETVVGSGGPHDDWDVTALAGAVMAMVAALEETRSLRQGVADDAQTVADDKVIVVNAKDEAVDAAQTAANALNSFATVYRGAHATPPANGEEGHFYFDTSLQQARVYTSVGWAPLFSVTLGGVRQDHIVAEENQTVFTVDGGGFTFLNVFLNGVLLQPGEDYTASSPNFTLADPASEDDVVAYLAYYSTDQVDFYTKEIADERFALADDTYSKDGADAKFALLTRKVEAGTGLEGGGTLAADRTLAVKYGTTGGTAAQGNDSRITGAVQKAGSGQELTGSYHNKPHNYGLLSAGNIQLSPVNGLAGRITRNNSSNEIRAPIGTPAGVYTMVIFIDGTSSGGSPQLTGFDNTNFGDPMPGSGQHAWLYVTCGPDAKTAKIEAIDY